MNSKISGESRRLRALAGLDILDTEAESDFDGIVELASQVTGCPISLISLVDSKRQWFKARKGLDVKETAREISFCTHAIENEDAFIVNDATTDDRFKNNPLVTGDPSVRFYAGQPLVTSDGSRIGTLCTIDRKPRELTAQQLTQLEILANQAVRLMELRSANRRLAQLEEAAKTEAQASAKSLDQSESDQRILKQLIQKMPQMSFHADSKGNITEFNEQWYEYAGGPGHFKNWEWRGGQVHHPDDLQRTLERWAQSVETGEPYEIEYRLRRHDGEYRWHIGRAVALRDPSGNIMSWFGTNTDIHDQKTAAEKIAASEQLLSLTSNAIPELMAYLDLDGRYQFVNAPYEKWFQKPLSYFSGKTKLEVVGPARAHRIDAFFQRSLKGETVSFEDRAQYADGWRNVRFTMVPDIDPVTSKVRGVVTLVKDETDLIQARDEANENASRAREAEGFLQKAVAVAGVGFFDWDIRNDKLIMSERFKQLWDLQDGASLANAFERIFPDDRENTQRLIDKSMAKGEPYTATYRIIRPSDGQVIWIEAQGGVEFDSESKPSRFFGTVIDVTERKTLESNTVAVANSIPQLAWMAEADGAINWYNQRWYDYTGTTADQMRGWGWQAVHDPAHVERVTAKWQQHIVSGHSWEDLFPLKSRAGEWRWFLSRAEPIRDAAGNILRWFGTNTDVTEQNRTERELTRMASVVQSSTDFVGMSDAQFNPIFVNQAGRVMSGFGERDITKFRIADFFPEEDQAKLEQQVVPVLLRDGFWEGELRFRHFETGAIIPVLYNLFPIRDPKTKEIFGYATVTRDMTEQKRMERAILDSKEDADKANQAKSAFLANMSHEIRTPLGAIMGFSELAQGSAGLTAEVSNYLQVIQRNSIQTLKIVDDILDLAKVEAGRVLIEKIEVPLIGFLADFASIMGFKAREGGIAFHLEAETSLPDHVVIDPTRVRQVLTNAVGNAVKFTSRGSVILHVCFENNQLIFGIRDTGRGISKEQAAQLFQAFVQADISTTRRYGGTGLGLVLTKKLCQAMGGDFYLKESELDKGSHFVAKVAAAPSSRSKMLEQSEIVFRTSDHAREVAEIVQPLRNVKVLLVEDSPDNQQLIKLILTKNGATFTLATDGEKGVQAALAGDEDVILMDVQMPVMDGHEAVRSLRRQGFEKPIIALTAHAMKEEYERAMASGFTDYLSKPVNRKELLSKIATYTRPN